jgi:choline dehydrogenase-like flavoprotein
VSGLLGIDGPARLSCDVLVIGSGPGGATVAAALAEANVDVLVLEEGRYIPADRAPTSLSKNMPALWRGGGLTATLGATPIAYAEGRCAGGGSEINSAIFQSAPDTIIERWSRANGLADLTPAALAPYYVRAAEAVHASETAGPPGPPTSHLQQAGEAMGWRVSPLRRARCDSPASRHRISGMASGIKQSMTMTLLPKAFSRGARLLPQCRVDRLLRKGRRVIGAQATAIDGNGDRQRITISSSAVFVCAGTTQTPALLQRSGIRRNVGSAFQLHPTVRVLARFAEPVDATRHHLPLVAITEFSPELRLGGSVFTLATYGLSLAEDWATRAGLLPDHRHFAMYYAMIRPDGVGSVRTMPAFAEPIVSYRLTERDWRRLGEGLERLSRALLSAGATRVIPSIRQHPGWASLDELARQPPTDLPRGRTALMTIHLFGSCPMGGRDSFFPIDPSGRLRDSDNLFVADASVLPGAPGVNPQATIMAFALRIAEGFIAARPSRP